MNFQRIDILKMIFGFCLLGILGVLAVIIVLQKVSAETSFQLEGVVTALATALGLFGGWAFREAHPSDIKPEEKKEK